jgi:hypothetical protein
VKRLSGEVDCARDDHLPIRFLQHVVPSTSASIKTTHSLKTRSARWELSGTHVHVGSPYVDDQIIHPGSSGGIILQPLEVGHGHL